MKSVFLVVAFSMNAAVFTVQAQRGGEPSVPAVLSAVAYDASGALTYTRNGEVLKDAGLKDLFLLEQLYGNPKGTEKGLSFDFDLPDFDGQIVFGPVDEAAKHPTVLWGNGIADIENGKTEINIVDNLLPRGMNRDFMGVIEKGHGLMAYRVLTSEGVIVYEGRVAIEGNGPFTVIPTIVEGPFINKLSESGCVISFDTHVPVSASIEVGGKTFKDPAATMHHEITVTGLTAATSYDYTVNYGKKSDRHTLKTAPEPGSRKPFTFAYASASRWGGSRETSGSSAHITGGGERSMWGVNAQSMRAIMAISDVEGAAFFQATGDITGGNTASVEGHLLDYANWKRAIEPWWHSIPVYVGMGNHESVVRAFRNEDTGTIYRIDNFPYETSSGEAAFAKAFVLPQNGPESEDGAVYDPNPGQKDFPGYKENVYYYTYDNVAVIVMNTDYWLGSDAESSSNRDGYIMDNQFMWLTETVNKLEKDNSIDHIFVTTHSSFFPNGEHMGDAFWHGGKNDDRAKVAGKPLSKGVLERRDEILDLLVNKSQKFIAALTGDEHFCTLTEVTTDFPMYPDNYNLPKLKLSRPFYQILNGGGGSGTYSIGGRFGRPVWVDHIKVVCAPPTVCLISVDGKKVSMKVVNAETLDTVCEPVRIR